MAEKTVKSRIQVKRGTSAQWQEAESNAIKNGKTPFTPYEGEIIFYSDLNKIKIGDGVSVLSSLPFMHVDKSEIDNWSHSHDDKYYTESEVDTKLAGKAASSHTHGNIANGGTLSAANMVVVTDGNKKITTSSTISTTELGYLDGVTSKIQDQLNGKSATGHTHDDRYYTESESDARFAPISHNHASNTINAMTGYSKPSSTSAISTSDTLNSAIGKLEKALDGKGTSNLALGTTSTTAAKGDHTHDGRYYTESESDSRFAPTGHTHDVSIAASSGTNELTLAHGTKYALTAGGQSFVFTMPSDTNTWRPVGTGATDAAAGNHTHDGRYYTESEIDTKLASYMPKSGGSLDNGATLKFTQYGTRTVTISGNNIDADMSADSGTWAGNFATVKHSKGTTTMLGWHGSKNDGLYSIFMGGSYDDPAMKMDASGNFSFKNGISEGGTLLSSKYAAASHGTHVTAATVKSALGTSSTGTGFLKQDGTWATPTNTTYSLVGANGTTGLVKNGSSVTSTSGLTACPIISGVPYYKDTNTQAAYGNITTSGTITSTAVTSATGVLVYDSSNKIQRATVANTKSILGMGDQVTYSFNSSTGTLSITTK